MSPHTSLLVCPKNLKECIDWVLRATGKDNGQDNIYNLKDALEAELEGSDLTELTQLNALASGLGFLAGLPACLCKTKKSVKEGLKKIYKELKTSLISCKDFKLNCPSCSKNLYPCKCCVIQSIKDVKKCDCIKPGGKKCHCNGKKVSCAKVLAGLEACLHLQCLQADMNDICQCNDSECCKTGQCDGKSPSCGFCKNLQTKTPLPTTGLGLSPPNPIRLAKRLDKFFGGKHFETPCSCRCNGSTSESCCCLACPGNCSQACSCVSTGQCDHGSSKECPRKTFCLAIDDLKVNTGTSLMKCCKGGTLCHCHLGSSSGSSDQTCCKPGKLSVKCLIRRLVSYFKDLKSDISSTPSKENFKNCCELLCVIKTCHFLNDFLSGSQAKDFNDALNDLRFAGPCGQELWRTLDDFLNFIRFVFWPRVKGIQGALEDRNSGHAKKCKCSGGSCKCSTQGSCEGCQAVLSELKKLQAHKDVLGLMTRGYSSAYSSEASWPSPSSIPGPCCGSLSSSCTCPSSCSSSGSCPSKCCPDCPQRRAAKIFLGFLPCLYYGLKILYDRCQDPLTWPDWQHISILSGKPESALAKFLQAWGYDLDPLKSKKGTEFFSLLENLFSSGSFKSLFETSKKYFTSFHSRSLSSPGSKDPSPPKTVRQMLLWLYGLRFQKSFPSLVLYCSSLCLPFGNSFNSDAFCYYLHLSCFLAPISIISFIEDSESTVTKFFSSAYSEFSKFSYPSDPSELLEKLCEYVRKIYIPLKFLQYQCERNPDQAGWTSCRFGQKCVEALQKSSTSVPSGSSSGCDCLNSKTYLCTNSHSSCSAASCSSPCPHHLVRFLIDDYSDSQSKEFPTPFQPPKDFPPMGFKNLSPTAKSGYGLLHGVLIWFCREGFYPLTRLVQFAFWVSRYPETLGELFAFFFRFSESDVFKNFGDYVDGEPGRFLGKALQDAVRGFYGSKESHSGNSHPYDLRSLIACPAPKASPTCGGYLHPLTYNAYNNNIFIKDFLDTYLSWVCHLTKDFEKKLKGFYNEASEKFKSCCLSSGKCQKIVHCPCALPFLYSFGFGFWSPKGLNCESHGQHTPPGQEKDCTLRSCKNFIDQLGKVLQADAPLQKLLDAIEEFLWSIRKPFFLFVLAFWALVISYFLYVQLYKLDLLHLKSHAHFSRSFKILPSTLFSDASSKLKDLSYFTL